MMKKLVLLSLVSVLLVGCITRIDPNKVRTTTGISTDTTSSDFSHLSEKVEFLEDYVTFYRKYEKLDFKILYVDNSLGDNPSSSEWSISLVATVPQTDVHNWFKNTTQLNEAPNKDWLDKIPTEIDHSTITEWYSRGRSLIGVDKVNNRVAFHNVSSE